MEVNIKRVYEQQEPEEGYRVLVDRLWPRGVKKADLAPDYWAKELAPSTETRKAFAHKAENFEEFKGRYLAELDASDDARACAERLRAAAEERGGTLTLLYTAKDPQVNHAIVLKGWLERQFG